MDDTWSYTDDKLVATYPKRPETWNRDLPMFAHLFCRCAGPEAALSLSLAFTKYPGCIWSWCHLMWILLFANLLNLFWGGQSLESNHLLYHSLSLLIIIYHYPSIWFHVSIGEFRFGSSGDMAEAVGDQSEPMAGASALRPGSSGGPTGGDVAMTRGSVLLG